MSLENGDVVLDVDLRIYSVESTMKAAHKFSGYCYVSMTQSDTGTLKVTLTPKASGRDIDALLGEFRNELLDQRLRAIVGSETRNIRDIVMAHALSRTGFIRPDLESEIPPCDKGK